MPDQESFEVFWEQNVFHWSLCLSHCDLWTQRKINETDNFLEQKKKKKNYANVSINDLYPDIIDIIVSFCIFLSYVIIRSGESWTKSVTTLKKKKNSIELKMIGFKVFL